MSELFIHIYKDKQDANAKMEIYRSQNDRIEPVLYEADLDFVNVDVTNVVPEGEAGLKSYEHSEQGKKIYVVIGKTG